MALQQTTRELWAQQGPFESYTIHGVPQQNIPEIYIKGAVWNAQADCHGSDGKVPDSAVMTTRAGSILVMDYS
jgi:hypothetical protein